MRGTPSLRCVRTVSIPRLSVAGHWVSPPISCRAHTVRGRGLPCDTAAEESSAFPQCGMIEQHWSARPDRTVIPIAGVRARSPAGLVGYDNTVTPSARSFLWRSSVSQPRRRKAPVFPVCRGDDAECDARVAAMIRAKHQRSGSTFWSQRLRNAVSLLTLPFVADRWSGLDEFDARCVRAANQRTRQCRSFTRSSQRACVERLGLAVCATAFHYCNADRAATERIRRCSRTDHAGWRTWISKRSCICPCVSDATVLERCAARFEPAFLYAAPEWTGPTGVAVWAACLPSGAGVPAALVHARVLVMRVGSTSFVGPAFQPVTGVWHFGADRW